MKKLKVLLIVIAVICIGVAASYPIRYKIEMDSNNSELEDLSGMRRRVIEELRLDESPEVPEVTETPETDMPSETEHPPETPETESPAATEQPPENPETERPEVPAETVETPAQTETAPEQTEAVPAQTEAAPIQTEAVPIQTEAVPIQTETVPAQTEEVPTQTEEVPTQTEAIPAQVDETPAATAETAVETPAPTPAVTPTPGLMDLLLDDVFISTPTPPASSTPKPTPGPTPSPTPNRDVYEGAETFKEKEKIRLDEDRILPELRDIYELNHDLVGWIYIEDTNVDYPVVQCEDGKFYLTHDFYGKSNANGQIILGDKCDPYTPSYNLIISGHHMNSGAMFGRLGKYKDEAYWETHKIVEFDTLMARKRYVIFAAFYSADYDEHEEGFRYSADIQYKMEADKWLAEIRENQIYDTGIDVEFGDEFITLTTCDHSRRHNGRFVLVARRIREGEKIL